VNVDFTASMLEELESAAKDLNVSRQDGWRILVSLKGAAVAFPSFRSRYGNSLRASSQPIQSTALNFSLDKW
jgi:hypothetical protein